MSTSINVTVARGGLVERAKALQAAARNAALTTAAATKAATTSAPALITAQQNAANLPAQSTQGSSLSAKRPAATRFGGLVIVALTTSISVSPSDVTTITREAKTRTVRRVPTTSAELDEIIGKVPGLFSPTFVKFETVNTVSVTLTGLGTAFRVPYSATVDDIGTLNSGSSDVYPVTSGYAIAGSRAVAIWVAASSVSTYLRMYEGRESAVFGGLGWRVNQTQVAFSTQGIEATPQYNIPSDAELRAEIDIVMTEGSPTSFTPPNTDTPSDDDFVGLGYLVGGKLPRERYFVATQGLPDPLVTYELVGYDVSRRTEVPLPY